LPNVELIEEKFKCRNFGELFLSLIMRLKTFEMPFNSCCNEKFSGRPLI
jgi:hypothetical protein